jgi:LmbE family N-acetylglucosaminyl deacetylase
MKRDSLILTIGAHNDDYIIGAGGTLAKYQREGKPFYSIIISYGEKSHPLFKKEVSRNMRLRESLASDKILKGSGLEYIDVEEGKFIENKEKIKGAIKKIINIKKPEKIFTHSNHDAHPDHKAVFQIVKELASEIDYKGEIYMFDVWHLFDMKKENNPQLVVDITSTFPLKVKAFKAHKSQQLAIWSLLWSVYLKARLNGLKYGYKYCETFTKMI